MPWTRSVCRFIRWNTFDAFYAASKREGFYISEMQTHIQALFNPTTAVRIFELKQWCIEAIAAGAKGLIYWMWRPFTKGLQTMGRGLVDYKNRSTPRIEFAKELSSLIEETGALTPVKSDVGILFDGTCQDFQVFYTKSYKVDQNIYLNSLCGAYKAFYDIGVRADIVKLNDIKNYKVLILSNHIVIGKEAARVLTEYVKNGGIIVCDGKIGIVDELSMLNSTVPGGDLNSCLGQEYIDSDYEELDFVYNGRKFKGYYGRDLNAVTDGRATALFSDGYPAIVEKEVGKGKIISINTYIWYGHKQDEGDGLALTDELAHELELKTVSVTEPLKVRVSENAENRYAFVFNYTNKTVKGRITGMGFDTGVEVAPQDVVVLNIKKQ